MRIKYFALTICIALSAGIMTGCGEIAQYRAMREMRETLKALGGSDIGEPDFLKGEYLAAYEEMSRNIYINNSRFALPMNIKDLPQGFTLDFSESEPEEANFMITETAELYSNGVYCGEASAIRRKSKPQQDGVIVALTLIASECKGSVGGLKTVSPSDEIKAVLGEPSVLFDQSPSILFPGENFDEPPNMIYATKWGGYIFFSPYTSAIQIYHPVDDGSLPYFGLNYFELYRSTANKNAQYIEYRPYDDFDSMPKPPPLSGEPRKIEWTNAPDSIVIGDVKLPLITKVSDWSERFTLIDFGTNKEIEDTREEINYGGYVRDSYRVAFMDRDSGIVIGAIRKKDEPAENAVINSVMTLPGQEKLFPISVLGAEVSDISEAYISDLQNDSFYTLVSGGDIYEDGEKYFCIIRKMSYTLFLTIESYENNLSPHERYEEWIAQAVERERERNKDKADGE